MKFAIFVMALISSHYGLAAVSGHDSTTSKKFYAKGMASLKAGNLFHAQNEFEAARFKDSKNAAPVFQLGLLAETQAQFNMALIDYKICLKLDPKHSGCRDKLARLESKTKVAR